MSYISLCTRPRLKMLKMPQKVLKSLKNSLKTLKIAQTVRYSGRDARVLAGILKSFSGYQVCNPKKPRKFPQNPANLFKTT